MEMKMDIQTLSFRANDALIDFAEGKINKLEQYSEKVMEAQMTLKIGRSGTRQNKYCQIRLVIPGYDLFTSKQCEPFEEAILKTSEALKQQMYRWKNNYKNLSLSKESLRR